MSIHMRLGAKISNAINCGLLFIGSTVLALGIAEGIVRKFAPQGVAVPWQDEIDGIRVSRPNVQGRHAIPNTFDVTVSTNAQRFRGRQTSALKRDPGTLRIATLGDSFTFGWGADDDKTYPAVLRRLIEERHVGKSETKLNVEVLNAGNGGTGTGEQALLYDVYVKKFAPQIVILGVNPTDIDDDSERNLFALESDGRVYPRPPQQIQAADSQVRSVRKVANSFPGYAFIVQRSQLFGLMRNQFSKLLSQTRKQAFANSVAEEKIEPKVEFQDALQRMAAEILWLKFSVEETNGLLVVVFLPTRDVLDEQLASAQPSTRTKAAEIVKTLQKTSGQYGIPFADITEHLTKRWGKKSDLYFSGLDTHPTPAGYEAIAEGVYALLESSGLVLGSGKPISQQLR
jgi:lysophospholipase L1-like esterase